MDLLIYFGKVNLCWMLFYACYWLVLRRHTFFQWNRAYLLATLLLSLVLPAITFSGQAPVIEPVTYIATAIPVYIATPESTPRVTYWVQLIWAIQGIGAVVMLSKIAEAIRALRSLVSQGEAVDFDHYKLILLPHNDAGSFSFLRWIVVNRNDYENHFDLILSHETVHIRQMHSIDILLIELLKAAFWFNPALWLYKRSLQEVHEFLADEKAPNRDHYTQFLVSYALNSPVTSLTNHFFNPSLLLNRVQMIYKNRNSRWSLGKYLVVVPVIASMLLLTAARERLLNPVDVRAEEMVSVEGIVTNSSREPISGATIVVKGGSRGTSTDAKGHFRLDSVQANSSLVITHISYAAHEVKIGAKSGLLLAITLKNAENALEPITVVGYPIHPKTQKNDTVATRDMSNIVFTVVEQKPEFPGGQDALARYLSQNIIYPAEARENNTHGEVTISFIVNEKGYVRTPTIIKGLGSGIDEEAVRVVLNMPKWNPGIQSGRNVPVKYVMPIKFNLSEPSKEDSNRRQGFFPQREMPTDFKLRDFALYDQKPLIFVNGTKQKERGNDGLKGIDPNNIQSISVVKGKSATSAYGDEGKNGVILVETKK